MTNIKYIDKKDMFFCYSLRMFHHLKMNGFWYSFKDKNPSTDRYYWVFERSEELNEALDLYEKEKQKYFNSIK